MDKASKEYELWRDLYTYFDTYFGMDDKPENWTAVLEAGQKYVNAYKGTTAEDIATDLFVAVTSAIETKVMGREKHDK